MAADADGGRGELERGGDMTDFSAFDEARADIAPDLTSELSRLVRGVLNLTTLGRIVMLLDPLELLTQAERGSLDALAREKLALE